MSLAAGLCRMLMRRGAFCTTLSSWTLPTWKPLLPCRLSAPFVWSTRTSRPRDETRPHWAGGSWHPTSTWCEWVLMMSSICSALCFYMVYFLNCKFCASHTHSLHTHNRYAVLAFGAKKQAGIKLTLQKHLLVLLYYYGGWHLCDIREGPWRNSFFLSFLFTWRPIS